MIGYLAGFYGCLLPITPYNTLLATRVVDSRYALVGKVLFLDTHDFCIHLDATHLSLCFAYQAMSFLSWYLHR